jgi:hypothetical protein
MLIPGKFKSSKTDVLILGELAKNGMTALLPCRLGKTEEGFFDYASRPKIAKARFPGEAEVGPLRSE